MSPTRTLETGGTGERTRTPGVAQPTSRRDAGPRARTRRTRIGSQRSSWLVAALLVFLALEYLRPPALQALHLQAAFLVLIPLSWLSSKERPWSRTLTLQLLFLVTGAVMLPFATNYYVVYMNTRLMLGCLVTALAVIWLLAWRPPFRRVLWVWVAIICFQAAWALTHQGRGYGAMLGDENDLALACDMAIAFPLLGVRYFRGAKRWLCGAVALLLIAGCVVSWSRGGFLGLIAAGAYGVLVAGRHRVRNIALGVAVAVAFYLAVPSSYKDEMRTIQNTDQGTAETRFFLWATATRIWLDHPILGAGPDNGSLLLGQYQPDPTRGGLFSAPVFRERDWSTTAIHSVYFQLLADRGIVGVSLFAWMAVSFYIGLRRLRRDVQRARGIPSDLDRDAVMYSLALEAAMAGFLVAGAFLSMAYYPYFWFFTALAVAHERAIRRELVVPRETRETRETPRPQEPEQLSTWAAILRASPRGESGRS